MFEIVKCLRDKSSPTASVSLETAKPEEVKLSLTQYPQAVDSQPKH